MGGLSERPSPKKVVAANGLYFGWLCISLRHPVAQSSRPNTPMRAPLCWNKGHLFSTQIAQKFRCRTDAELRIGRFDAQEELVYGSPFELLDIEDRVVRLRQTVNRQHAKQRCQTRDQDHALE